jgi:predicted enzyme related to lactoylglutathione lyase
VFHFHCPFAQFHAFASRKEASMTATATPITNVAVSGGRFSWHELMTTDPVAAQSFYREVIGWTTQKYEGGIADYTMWVAGETPLGGVMTLPEAAVAMNTPPHWLAYIDVVDADATINQAVSLGAAVLVPAKTVDQVGRFAVLADPQGAVFAIIANASPLPPEHEPAKLEFCWHELTTTDVNAAIKFYETIFGWQQQREFDMGPDKGIYHIFGKGQFTYGGMMNKPEGYNMPPSWLHYIEVDSADAATERAINAGGKVMIGPMEVPGGARISIMTDPQGVVFAVHSK